MPKFISLDTETDVKRLSKENYLKVAIKNKLKKEIIDISVRNHHSHTQKCWDKAPGYFQNRANTKVQPAAY